VQVIWQCGKFYHEEYKSYENDTIRVRAFIERMDLAYAAADVIISRSGASSVSELCIVGKPVIFIPSPNVAEDHQTKNAQAIVDAKGLKENQLDTQFAKTFTDLLQNEAWQAELGRNIRSLALPDATRDIVDEIEQLLTK
jgi:UDP-N-acetylglucosamine--N-acetylmuramyl-(pentapeptide) pyrophosphoryl-undecaprenol N-acetylglucosamine transferase